MSASSRWEWLDYDESESGQVRDFLSHDIEGEGVDPLRIGSSVRDRISEQLFPGTSTQYTRLRYVILTPAILSKPRMTLAKLLPSQEHFNKQFAHANPGETGVIGRRKPKRDFVHLYWTAIRTWGLLGLKTEDERDLTVANGLAAFQSPTVFDEEGNTLSSARVAWDPAVVQLVNEFWKGSGTAGWPEIHCRRAEVDYLLGRWQELREKPALSAFAEQIRRRKVTSTAPYPWLNRFKGYPEARRDLDRAKHVSLICWSAQLAYNFALLKAARKLDRSSVDVTWRRRGKDLDDTQADLDRQLTSWKQAFVAERASLERWVDTSAWEGLGSSMSRPFLAQTAAMLVNGEVDLRAGVWSEWVKERERVNPQPKLANVELLSAWSGTPEMARRWDFRWNGAVRRLVNDAENPRG